MLEVLETSSSENIGRIEPFVSFLYAPILGTTMVACAHASRESVNGSVRWLVFANEQGQTWLVSGVLDRQAVSVRIAVASALKYLTHNTDSKSSQFLLRSIEVRSSPLEVRCCDVFTAEQGGWCRKGVVLVAGDEDSIPVMINQSDTDNKIYELWREQCVWKECAWREWHV